MALSALALANIARQSQRLQGSTSVSAKTTRADENDREAERAERERVQAEISRRRLAFLRQRAAEFHLKTLGFRTDER
jgi:hypothetical protein